MPITPTEKIWLNGELVDWDQAQIHVLTHSLHYGMGVFEGIRAYETSEGPAVFRLTDHMERLHNSARILMMDLPLQYVSEALATTAAEVARDDDDGAMPADVRSWLTLIGSRLVEDLVDGALAGPAASSHAERAVA